MRIRKDALLGVRYLKKHNNSTQIALNIWLYYLLLSGFLLVIMAGCANNSETTEEGGTLTVFAAASLTDAFQEIGMAFMEANPGTEIVFSFAGSSALATQILEGAPADVFASANEVQMQVVLEAERITGIPQIFAQNALTVALPADNPANIQTLADLANEGIQIVVAAPGVPVREYTDTMLDLMADDPAFGSDYRDAVRSNIVSEESNVRQVLVKIALAEADAGIVYQSDITPDAAENIITLAVSDAFSIRASYPIAVLEGSENAALAERFIAFILSKEGQAIITHWGLIPVS